jgi:hypothetical protein
MTFENQGLSAVSFLPVKPANKLIKQKRKYKPQELSWNTPTMGMPLLFPDSFFFRFRSLSKPYIFQ